MAQFVGVHHARLQPAAVEVAVIMRAPDGRFVHRRVSCSGPDLRKAVGDLCNPDAAALAAKGEPTTLRHVQDEYFSRADQALRAAEHHDPVADPTAWLSPAQLIDEDFDDLVQAEGARLGRLGNLAVTATFLAALVALMQGSKVLVIRFPGLGGDGWDTGEDLLGAAALGAAGVAAYGVGGLLGRLKLARARRRSQSPGSSVIRTSGEGPNEPASDSEEMGGTPRWIRMQTVGVLVAALALLPLVGPLENQANARSLVRRGALAVAEGVRVNVAGTAFWEQAPSSPAVRDVQVKLAGAAQDGWLPLMGVTSPELAEDGEGTVWRTGWQGPSSTTGYVPPLTVRQFTNPDGSVVVMAEEDMSYWIYDDHHGPAFLFAGLGALLLIMSAADPAGWRARRKAAN